MVAVAASKRNRRRRIGLAAVTVLSVVGLAAWSFAVGASADPSSMQVDREFGDGYDAADLGRQSRWQSDSWPPRPDGAGPATKLPTVNPPAYGRDPLAQQVAADSRVAPLLGDRWSVLEVAHHVPGDKGTAPDIGRGLGRSRVTYYSRSTNQSVIAEVAGRRVEDVSTVAPTENQLPVSPEEADDAVAIARAYWSEQGEGRVDDLEGFVIMAFKPDGSLFDSRMVYVSFHVNADELPEFITWVDLTEEAVSHGRQEVGS